ncbi:uncharacterized mitochondrial protein-like protein [Tanacetum coccineum]
MSMMGELKFFLGLQVHQSSQGIFLNQSKYALDIRKKHGIDKCNSIVTPMATSRKLDADLSGTPVDQTKYHSMIGSLMYSTASRPDLVHAYFTITNEVLQESTSNSSAVVDFNDLPIFVCYPNLQGNPDIGTTVEYQKTPLASLDLSALDKPHFQLKNLLRRFIHESNADDACTNDGVTTSSITVRLTTTCSYSSFKDIHLASKVQEIKKAQEQTKTKTFLKIQNTIGTSREIVSFQDDAKYEHVGPKYKVIQGFSQQKVLFFIKRRLKYQPLLSRSSITRKDLKYLETKDKGSRSMITMHEGTKPLQQSSRSIPKTSRS